MLSKNFTLSELTKSSYAVRNGLSNIPSSIEVANLKALCVNVLQPLRDKFGVVNITSGYRAPAVNIGIGGSRNSDHCRGMAADLEIPGVSNRDVVSWIRLNLPFKQLILEYGDAGWVHVSYDPRDLRKEVLSFDGKSYKKI
jgi:zinc D-Ala-D-Ala carboxypeptidase